MASRESALAELRKQQERERVALGVERPIGGSDTRAAALAKADQRERESVIENDTVYSWHFRYPAQLERKRWARTRDIILRVAPGADEDASYLEMVARQAASVEMILRGEYTDTPDAQMSAILDRVLIGTVPTLRADALSRRFGDHFFVLISAGLIDFVYQAARAAVLSWKPVAAEGTAAFSFRNTAADVDEVLAADAAPARLLRDTLEAFLFSGFPRAVGFAPPAENYQAPLLILTNANERFVLAHEYGHTLHDAFDIVPADGSPTSEEFAADLLAFRLVVQSGDVLDGLPPNFSSQGAYFVLTVLDVLRQALDIARYGEIREDRGFVGHPPLAARLACLREAYLTQVSSTDDDLWIEPALSPARTLEQLFARVIAEVQSPSAGSHAWTGRVLHRTWDQVR